AGARESPERGPQPRRPLPEFRLLLAIEPRRRLDGDFDETQPVAGPQLADEVQVGARDLGDLRIAADGLAVHAEDDALAVARDLHGARTDRLRHEFALGQRERLSLQTQAHAIAGGRDRELLPEEVGGMKPIGLRASEDANVLWSRWCRQETLHKGGIR